MESLEERYIVSLSYPPSLPLLPFFSPSLLSYPRLKSCTHSNKKLMKKVETLETENHSLRQQLAHLQALVVRATNPATLGGRPIQFGSCLMVRKREGGREKREGRRGKEEEER